MSDLLAFLRARLDHDESVARAVAADMPEILDHDDVGVGIWEELRYCCVGTSPARVMRQVEAMRRILSRCDLVLQGVELGAFNEGQATDARDNLRALALTYSDHPEYDDAWQP